MPKYQYKKTVVEAVQYGSDGSSNDEIIALAGGHRAYMNLSKSGQLMVQATTNGWAIMEEGQWVVLYPWGDIGIMDGDTFKAYYYPKP
jgi:hypothetical protein